MGLPVQVLPCDSVQPAPLRHGADTHSSMSMLQLKPVYPASQAQMYQLRSRPEMSAVDAEQTPPFWHGPDRERWLSFLSYLLATPSEVLGLIMCCSATLGIHLHQVFSRACSQLLNISCCGGLVSWPARL